MRILCFDPGNTIGWVVAEVVDDEVTILEFGQRVFPDAVDGAFHLTNLAVLYRVDQAVAERFDLRPGNKFIADLSPVEVLSAFKALCVSFSLRDLPVTLQTPAQAKGLVKNENLKNLGWYPTGKDVGYKDANDVRDAFRHLVYFLRHNKKLMQQGWQA